MGFKTANMAAVVRFNSANSSNFLDAYETYLHDTVQSSLNRPKSRTFAPSSFRCARKNWFRLRGTAPDIVQLDMRKFNRSYLKCLGKTGSM